MNKPLFIVLCIYVYRIVFTILKLPLKLIKYFSLGFFFVLYYTINMLISIIAFIVKYCLKGIATCFYLLFILIKFLGKGFVLLSFIVYKFIKYLIYGLVFPFVLLSDGLTAIINKIRLLVVKSKEEKKHKKELRAKEKQRKMEEKQRLSEKRREEKLHFAEIKRKEKLEKEKKREEVAIKKQEELAERKKKRQKDVYVNEKVKVERKNLATRINDLMVLLAGLPVIIKKFFVNKYENSTFVKNRKNKKDIDRQALLLNFEGDDAKKSDVKIIYQYEAKSPEGKFVKGTFEAFSKVEVHSYLLSEGYEVYKIKTSRLIQMLYGQVGSASGKVKNKDLIFFLTQLSTYIKAGIPLVEALRILTRQYKNKRYKRIFGAIIYDLTMGDNFSTALEKQGNAFPRLLINMIKASELTGELPEALDDMANYYTETEKTRKQMITAMTYPTIIFVMALAVMTFIMIYVVPNFVSIYEDIDGASIPGITLAIMSLSRFLRANIIWVLVGIVIFLIIFIYLYKNVKMFKTLIQWLLMHIPVVKNIIIYNEVTMFTKTFASLLKHNVFITDSMEILNKITNNEIYKMLILDTITNLARGEKISTAFKDQWAFPIPAYEMIVTGEKTGQLAEMMQKVSDYYQELHANLVTRLKTFIEPFLIIFLTTGVGVIVLSIVIPMFDIYNSIQITENDSTSLLG